MEEEANSFLENDHFIDSENKLETLRIFLVDLQRKQNSQCCSGHTAKAAKEGWHQPEAVKWKVISAGPDDP